MVKDNRNNGQIYGRNDMIMLDQNNKIYGSLGLADNYVMKTEEGTKLALSNPKLGSFADVLTEFNIYGHSEQESTTGANLIDVDSMLNECLVKNADDTYSILKTETNRFSKSFPVNLKAGTKVSFNADVIEYNGVYNLKLQVNTGYGTISVGKTLTLKSDITDVTIYQDGNNDVGTYTKFKNAILSVGEAKVPYEPYTGGKPSPSPDYPQEIKSVVNPTVKVTNEDGTKSQTVTLPYTLNAIPVTSGGNVTIDGKQYIADYVDVERGKLVRMCKEIDFTKVKQLLYSNLLTNTKEARYSYDNNNIKPLQGLLTYNTGSGFITRAMFIGKSTWNNDTLAIAAHGQAYGKQLSIRIPVNKDAIEYFTSIGGCKGIFQIETPEEIDLMPEQIQAYKSLSTYYPVTIIENNYNTWMKATYKSTESV